MAYMLIAILVIYVFVITWPASIALLLVLLVWFVTRKSLSPFAPNIHEAALPMLIGIGVFWAMSLVLSLSSQLSESNRESLLQAEQWLLPLNTTVNDLARPILAQAGRFVAVVDPDKTFRFLVDRAPVLKKLGTEFSKQPFLNKT